MLIRVPEALANGRFVVAGRIGAGGMAIVHLAWDRELDDWCAVKFLAPEFLSKQKIRARFQTEASTMGQLDDPHVLGLLHADMEADPPYLVMELATCGAIEQWLSRNGAMPPPLAARVAHEAALGLAEAHSRGIVHRDVKPDNLLVAFDGRIQITDFGIATELDAASMTRTGSVMGTYAYMSPEQKNDAKTVDVRSDVYALAATTIALLEGGANHDVLAVVHDPSLREHIPAPLWSVLARALAYRPEDRFANAGEMADALGAILRKLGPIPRGTPPLTDERLDPGDPPDLPEPPLEEEIYDAYAQPGQRLPTPRSLPPAHLRPAAPPPRRRSSCMVLLLLPLVLAAGVGVLGLGGALFLGAQPVNRAAEAYEARAAELERIVHQQSTIVSDLEQLGADWETPMKRLDAMGTAEPGARRADAEAFVTACEKGFANLEPDEELEPVRTAAADKLFKLVTARDAVREQRDVWENSTHDPLGQLAVTVGMASAP